MFREVRHAERAYGCRRAILVGHNAAFDLGFLNAAVARAQVKRNPFHPFSCFDTATLAGAALGQTVLAKALTVAGLEWDAGSAHIGELRRRTHRRHLLLGVQPAARELRAGERASAGARLAQCTGGRGGRPRTETPD